MWGAVHVTTVGFIVGGVGGCDLKPPYKGCPPVNWHEVFRVTEKMRTSECGKMLRRTHCLGSPHRSTSS